LGILKRLERPEKLKRLKRLIIISVNPYHLPAGRQVCNLYVKII